MGVLDGKTVLVTGVLTEASIAFRTAAVAHEEGARVVLTGVPGRSFSLTQRISRRLPCEAPVVELDVTDAAQLDGLGDDLTRHQVDRLDGVVHAIGFAPESALGGGFLSTQWEDVATTIQISTYSHCVDRKPPPSAVDVTGKCDRRAGLRRDCRVAGVRLDGRCEGRSGVGMPLSRA